MITSVDNARVKAARALHRPKRRRETGLCLLEGPNLIETGLEAGAQFVDVFVTPTFAAKERGVPLLEALKDRGVAVTYAKEHVLERLSHTTTPQGIAAVVRMQSFPKARFLEQKALLIADRVADPGNIGTMVRSAAAVGAALWTSVDSADLYDPKALRASVGTLFLTPHDQRLTCEEIVTRTRATGHALVVADASGTVRYDEFNWRQPYALVIGNEARGVDPFFVQQADGIVSLPLQPGVESLNAAVTASICLFEAWRQRNFSRG